MVDPWTGPTPVTNQFLKNEPNGLKKLLDVIKGIETHAREATSNLLRTAGIYLTTAGMTIDSNLAVTGTLSLPAGIISNDALASPVVPGVGGGFAMDFAVATTSTTVESVTIPIPVGFTQALVHVTVAASAYNSSVSWDTLYVRAAITLPGGATTDGTEIFLPVTTAAWTTGSASLAGVFSGLSPGSITVACKVRSGYGPWSANVANVANVDASVIFLR